MSGCVQAHAPQVPHLSSKLPLLIKMNKNRREHCRYYLCGAHHTDAPSSTLEIQLFVKTWAAICVVHTAQIAFRAPCTKTFRKWHILYVRCSPHRWNFECDLCGVHHANAIYVVYTTRMRFTRCTPYKSPKGAIYVVHTTRMRITRCTPHNSPKDPALTRPSPPSGTPLKGP